jgi:hypothetical protein
MAGGNEGIGELACDGAESLDGVGALGGAD